MPKPTTHTDIVVVTKQDPAPTGGRVNESVQIMLVAAKDGTAETLVAEKLREAGPKPDGTPATGIESKLVAFKMGDLILGYTVSITFGRQDSGRRIAAEINNEPWGWNGQLSPAAASGGSHSWTNNANDALIAKMTIDIKGEVSGQALTCVGTPRQENGLQKLTARLELNGKHYGTLEMTASMDAS